MNPDNSHRFRVIVEFEYDAEIFPSDPEDVYELAELESEYLEGPIRTLLDAVENPSVKRSVIEPVL